MGEFAKPEAGAVEEAQTLLAAIIASSDDAIIERCCSELEPIR